MAQFIYTIPDDSVSDLINGVCLATGWTSASGVAQNDWAAQQAINWFKATAKRGLLKQSQSDISSQIDPVAITSSSGTTTTTTTTPAPTTTTTSTTPPPA